MSKSYGNTIQLSDSPEVISEKVRQMITDPQRIKKTDPGNPQVCTVFAFHKVFNTENYKECEENCKAGKIGCVQCKKILAEKVINYMQPIYEKRKDLETKEAFIKEVIEAGNENARKIARKTINEVKEVIGVLS